MDTMIPIMPVYIDNACISYGRLKMSHMVADTNIELTSMAIAIGVDVIHIQDAGTYREHFDVCKVKRLKAIKLGVIPVNSRKVAEIITTRRKRFMSIASTSMTDSGSSRN